MVVARSSADLSPAQVDRFLGALAVGKAMIAAIGAGLPVGELGSYDWRVDVDPREPAGGQQRPPSAHGKRLVG